MSLTVIAYVHNFHNVSTVSDEALLRTSVRYRYAHVHSVIAFVLSIVSSVSSFSFS